MIVGVVKEIKAHEYRVGLIPSGVAALVKDGHQVLAETSAGQGPSFSDADCVQAGAKILDTPQAVFERADMIVKVQEPQAVRIGWPLEVRYLGNVGSRGSQWTLPYL